jgi:3-keto-disaccharide hydrolase
MKTLTVGLLVTGVLTFRTQAETIRFDTMETGKAPVGWIATLTGKGQAKWAVVANATAPSRPNVLKQSGEATFAVCLHTNSMLKDGFVQVKFKPLSGKEDESGGVIWRAKDANNYYVCRANALEDNVVLYKTVAGKRKVLEIVGRKRGYGVREKVAPRQWHTLRVEFASNRFQVTFDGKRMFDVEDNTLPGAGYVGLWTKADSVTLFDDFEFGAK